MESKSRKKSINLLLCVTILLSLIAVIFLSIFLIKHPKKKNSVASLENTTQQTEINNNLNKISNSNTYSYDSNNVTNIYSENTYSPPISNTITLNDHTFKFKDSLDISILNSSSIPEIQVISNDFGYKMLLNTNKLMSFINLKEHSDLTNYLTSTYNINITSDIKYGTLNNIEILICSINDNDLPAYFLITQLNSDEILYAKIYNTADINNLIYDLSVPVSTLSNIISSVQ